VLGKWRLRGNEAGAIYLERLDTDGAVVSDGWVNVGTFVHNPDNNVPGLEVFNLGAQGVTTLGTLLMNGDIAADTLRARSTTQVTVQDSLAVAGDLTALNATVGALTATSEILIDTIRARVENQVTIADSLAVTGSLTAQGVDVVQRFNDTRLHPDVVRFAPNLLGYTQILSSLDVSGDMSVTNVIYSQGEPVALRSQTEPLFTAVDPLYKNLNLQTGAYELKVRSPFWCAGRVNGATLATVASIGRVGYTVSRPDGFPVGVYEIRFASPAPNNNYVISLTQQGNGNIKIWDATLYDGPPTAARFNVVCYNTNWQVADFIFHFSVVV
jgi:hypothetical protein